MPRSICGTKAAIVRLLLIAALVLAAHRQAAANEATASGGFREIYERAGRLYSAKDYAAAIPVLHAAYAVQPVPQLLFNIAQAYRRLEQWSSSRVYFEMYRMLLPNPTPEALAPIDRALVEVRGREQDEKKPQVIEKTRTLVVQTEKPVPRWLRPLGITSSLVGLGLAAAGGTMLGLHGTCASPAVAPAVACDQVYSTQTLGIGLTAAGAGVLLVGVVTLSLSFRKPQRAQPRVEDELPSFQNMLQGTQAAEPPPSGWNSDGTPRLVEPPPAGWNTDGSRAR